MSSASMPFERLGPDGLCRHHFDHPGAAEEELERQRFHPVAGVEEVPGRIDVGAGVSAHVERRHVGTASLGDALDRLEGKGRVAGVNGKCGIQRNGDVDEFHGRRGGDDSTAGPEEGP